MRDTRIPPVLLSEAGKKWDGRPIPVEQKDVFAGDNVTLFGGGLQPGTYNLTGGAAQATLPAGKKKFQQFQKTNYMTRKDEEASKDPRFSNMFNKEGGGGGGGGNRPMLKLVARSTRVKEGGDDKGWAPGEFTEVKGRTKSEAEEEMALASEEGGELEAFVQEKKEEKREGGMIPAKPWAREVVPKVKDDGRANNAFAAAFESSSDEESSDDDDEEMAMAKFEIEEGEKALVQEAEKVALE